MSANGSFIEAMPVTVKANSADPAIQALKIAHEPVKKIVLTLSDYFVRQSASQAIKCYHNYSPVAQQVERVAVNHLVGSSSLSRGAISTQKGHFACPFFAQGLRPGSELSRNGPERP